MIGARGSTSVMIVPGRRNAPATNRPVMPSQSTTSQLLASAPVSAVSMISGASRITPGGGSMIVVPLAGKGTTSRGSFGTVGGAFDAARRAGGGWSAEKDKPRCSQRPGSSV